MVVPFAVGSALLLVEVSALAVKHASGLLKAAAVAAFVLFFAWNYAAMLGVGTYTSIYYSGHPSSAEWNFNFQKISGKIWHEVGNPLAWPASLPWAMVHGSHPRAWDTVASGEFVRFDYITRRVLVETTTIEAGLDDEYFSAGFDRKQKEGNRFFRNVHGEGGILFALFSAWIEKLVVHLAVSGAEPAQVKIAVNGGALAEAVEASRCPCEIPVKEGQFRVGTNHLIITTSGGPVRFYSLKFIPRPDMPERF